MSRKIRFIFVLSSLLFLFSFLSTQAADRSFSDTWQCNTEVDVKDCQFTSFDSNSSFGAQSYQLYRADTSTTYNGHDNDSTARVDVCISNAAQMWTGICQAMFQRVGVKGLIFDSSSLQAGSGDISDYNIANTHVRVNDADSTTVLTFTYRRVSIDKFISTTLATVKVGDPITIEWKTSSATTISGEVPVKLTWSGAVGNDFQRVEVSDSKEEDKLVVKISAFLYTNEKFSGN